MLVFCGLCWSAVRHRHCAAIGVCVRLPTSTHLPLATKTQDAAEMIVLSYLMTEVQEEFGVSDYAASAIFSLVFVVRTALERKTHPLYWTSTWATLHSADPSIPQGMWIGLTCFGVLADKRGRRVVYVLSMATILLFGLLSSFTTTYAGLVVTRLIVGIGVGGKQALVW